jgi:hypothetical protein
LRDTSRDNSAAAEIPEEGPARSDPGGVFVGRNHYIAFSSPIYYWTTGTIYAAVALGRGSVPFTA